MNDQLQQALAATINKANSSIDAGVSFLQAQLPDVVHQLLIWKATQAGLHVFFALIGIAVACIVLKKAMSVVTAHGRGASMYWRNSGNEKEAEGRRIMDEMGGKLWFAVPGSVIAIVIVLLSILEIPGNIATTIEVLIAPKLYLIEYAAHLSGR